MVLNQYCRGPHWAVRQYLGSNIVGCVSFRGLAQIPSTALSLNFLIWPGLETLEVGDTILVVCALQELGSCRSSNRANDRRNLLDEKPERSAPF